METHDKEVRYDLYCRTCKHKDTPQADDPCDECLSTPMNDGSVKPVNYMEGERSEPRTRTPQSGTAVRSPQ